MDSSTHVMSNRENALQILRFGRPQRMMSGMPGHSINYFGVDHEDWTGVGDNHPAGARWTDIWGVGWHKEKEGVMGFPQENPLADVAALQGYRWPDPDDERLTRAIYERAQAPHDPDTFLCGSHRDTLWERAYMLVGMENMMAYFYTEPTYAREILRHIMDFQLGIAEHYLNNGVEMVSCSDDLGTQHSLLLSPEIIRGFLVPEYRRLFSLYKEHGVIIHFHSCGYIEPLLELFIELGIDCLNPVQATANSLANVLTVARGRIAVQGGISSGMLMDGPVERIRSQVRQTLALAGRSGGFFCAPDQGMPFPKEHLDALYQTIDEWNTETAGR